MADDVSNHVSGSQDIDWNALRAVVRGAVQSQLGRAEPELIEDLTQEALIGILRVLRREEVRDLKALARTVARSTAIDEIRRRQRERPRMGEWADETAAVAPAADSGADSPEFLWFLLVEYFRTQNSPCHRLANLYVEKGDWRSVAAELNLSYDAVRMQWSRGTRAFRAALGPDPGPFKEWLDDV